MDPTGPTPDPIPEDKPHVSPIFGDVTRFQSALSSAQESRDKAKAAMATYSAAEKTAAVELQSIYRQMLSLDMPDDMRTAINAEVAALQMALLFRVWGEPSSRILVKSLNFFKRIISAANEYTECERLKKQPLNPGNAGKE
jgi:hypothetical protein